MRECQVNGRDAVGVAARVMRGVELLGDYRWPWQPPGRSRDLANHKWSGVR
jgi:hypothetical protein